MRGRMRRRGGGRGALSLQNEDPTPQDGWEKHGTSNAKFAGPTGQRRAKISGNCSRMFLVRARGAAPGGPQTKSTPGRSRAGPGQVPGGVTRALQQRTNAAPRRPREPPEGPRRLKIASRWFKTAHEAPKRPPRGLREGPRGLPRGPREAKIINFTKVLEGFLPSRIFGIPTAQDDPRGPQDRPKIAREASKMAP